MARKCIFIIRLIKVGDLIMGKKKTAAKAADKNIFSFDCDDEDEDGFSEGDGPIGDVFVSFNFGGNASETKAELREEPKAPEKLIDNRKLQKQPYGITPPVDGEHYEVKRTFMFRRSTVRMLNKLKAEHEDENVYLSSIVYKTVRHYHEFIFFETVLLIGSVSRFCKFNSIYLPLIFLCFYIYLMDYIYD